MKRLDYIDLAKGLGMLTIMWGHIHSGISTLLVYAFHIPLFFCLSGLVFSRKRYDTFEQFLKKRWKGLLFPYFIFSALTWVVWAVYSYVTHTPVDSYWMPLLETFIAQGSEGYLVHNVPLWFVMCLFSVEVIYFFTSMLRTIWNCIICVALGAVGAWMSVTDFYDFSILPWSLDVALMAIPFYALGSIVNEHIGHQKLMDAVMKHRGGALLVMMVAAVILYVGGINNGKVSMGHAHLGDNVFVFYFVALCGILAFMALCLLLVSLKSSNDSFLVRQGVGFGRSSFRAMAIHNPVKGIIIVLLAKFLHSPNSVIQSGTATSILAFLLTLLITVLLIRGIELILQKTVQRNSLLP